MTAPLLSRRPALRAPASGATAGRHAWMDAVRGLAVVLVVAYHGKTVLGRFVPEVPDALGLAQELFAPFRMPLLVFLSGMLLARSLAKPARAFAAGKLRRIAWPYAVWSVLFLSVSAQASPERLLLLVVDAPNYLWYLYYLVLYYAIAWALATLRVPLLLVVPAALLAAAVVDGYGPRRFLFLLAFFLGGQLVALHRTSLPAGHRGWWLSGCAAVAGLGALLSVGGVEMKYEPAFAVVPAAGIALCLLVAPAHTGGTGAHLLARVGRSSLVYYVAHYPVLWVLFTGLRALGVQAPLPMYALGLAVALAASAALVRLQSRSWTTNALFELPTHLPGGLGAAPPALGERRPTSDER